MLACRSNRSSESMQMVSSGSSSIDQCILRLRHVGTGNHDGGDKDGCDDSDGGANLVMAAPSSSFVAEGSMWRCECVEARSQVA
mmetsp:Transcript_19385/g.53927  ORF Transcript_19385/g.53927 Transcript_19385/m.53927 type:complete len:84 (+) Transcript_19385:2024-2275(+)